MEGRHEGALFEQSVRGLFDSLEFSERSQALWAKSGDESGSLSLPQHLMDAAGVAAVVYDAWVAKPLKRRLSKGLGLTDEQVRGLYVWLAGVHDVGKACLTFQTQLERRGVFLYRLSTPWVRLLGV